VRLRPLSVFAGLRVPAAHCFLGHCFLVGAKKGGRRGVGCIAHGTRLVAYALGCRHSAQNNFCEYHLLWVHPLLSQH
jgi:hypothetical protein